MGHFIKMAFFVLLRFGCKKTKSNGALYNVFSVDAQVKQLFGNAQTTDWVGRTVATLVLDENIEKKAGRVIWCYDVSIIQRYIIYHIFHIFYFIFSLLMNSELLKMMGLLFHLICALKPCCLLQTSYTLMNYIIISKRKFLTFLFNKIFTKLVSNNLQALLVRKNIYEICFSWSKNLRAESFRT